MAAVELGVEVGFQAAFAGAPAIPADFDDEGGVTEKPKRSLSPVSASSRPVSAGGVAGLWRNRSTRVSPSSPARRPIASASASVCRMPASIKSSTILATEPAPSGPTCGARAASAPATGRSCATSAAAPPRNMPAVPRGTISGPPKIGASTAGAPAARRRASAPRSISGLTVEVSTTSLPASGSAASAPSISATAASSKSDSTRMSEPSA
jgi:hypothetical protein